MAVVDLSLLPKELLPRRLVFLRCKKPDSVPRPTNVLVLRNADRSAPAGEHSSPLVDDTDDTLDASETDPLLVKPEMVLSPPTTVLTWREVRGPLSGLRNLGNTCFMNATLQALAAVPAIMNLFTTAAVPNDVVFNPIAAVAETFRAMRTSREPVAPTGLFLHLTLFLTRKDWRRGQQADAHEFAIKLLELCQNAFVKTLSGGRKLTHFAESTSPLMRVVGGYLRSQVSWSKEDEVRQLRASGNPALNEIASDANPSTFLSNTYEPTTVLHLPVAGGTIEDCLRRFCAPDLVGGKAYLTPRQVGVDVKRASMLHVLPNVLIVHFKRFTNTLNKVNRPVRFPELLDVTPFCTPECLKSYSSSEAKEYRLYSVVVHAGYSLINGHYIAYVRAANGLWYCCDDARVSQVSVQTVLNAQAFMLLYSKSVDGRCCDVKRSVVREDVHPVDPPATQQVEAGIAVPEPLSCIPKAGTSTAAFPGRIESVRKHRDPLPATDSRCDTVRAKLEGLAAQEPATLRKRAYEGVFATYQPDAEWDNAFDKPHERKVKKSREEMRDPFDGCRNRFQEQANIRLMQRGRRDDERRR